MITNELGSQYDAENQAVQEARRIQLEAYQAALLGTPPPTQDAEDELTVTDDTGVQYRIPLSQLTTQNERFEISTPLGPEGTTGQTEWAIFIPSGTVFDKSQFTGYREIVFRTMLGQTTSEVTATAYVRLEGIVESELEHTGTGDPDVSYPTDYYESGDISAFLAEGPNIYSTYLKVSDEMAVARTQSAAIVVRFGPELPDAPPDPPPAPTPNGNPPGPTLQGANHFWDFATYGEEGTGLLYDTGTEGTLPLTQPVGYDPTAGPGGGINTGSSSMFRNNLGPYPQLGEDDFTLLWVGEPGSSPNTLTMLNLSNGGNSIGFFGLGGDDSESYPLFMRFDLCYGDNCSEYLFSYSDTAAEPGPGLTYGSLTRQGTQLVLASSIDSTTFTIPVDADLTPNGSPVEIWVGSGQFGFTNAVAIWQGIALTEQQIETAAAELGWEA